MSGNIIETQSGSFAKYIVYNFRARRCKNQSLIFLCRHQTNAQLIWSKAHKYSTNIFQTTASWLVFQQRWISGDLGVPFLSWLGGASAELSPQEPHPSKGSPGNLWPRRRKMPDPTPIFGSKVAVGPEVPWKELANIKKWFIISCPFNIDNFTQHVTMGLALRLPGFALKA